MYQCTWDWYHPTAKRLYGEFLTLQKLNLSINNLLPYMLLHIWKTDLKHGKTPRLKKRASKNPLDIFNIANSFPQALRFPLSTNSRVEWIMTGHKTVRTCHFFLLQPSCICTTLGSLKPRLSDFWVLHTRHILQVTSNDHLRINSSLWTPYPRILYSSQASSPHP